MPGKNPLIVVGSVEVGVRIDPYGAAVGVIEAGEHALSGHARPGDHDRQGVPRDRIPDERGNPLVHHGRRVDRVAEWLPSIGNHDSDRVA
jgi:hypothetical protein